MRILMICAAVAPLLAVSPAVAAAEISAADYVKKAAAGDLYEKESSQLVLRTTANPAVRMFAQEMIRDHAKSSADIKAAAARSGLIAKPPALGTAQADMIRQLEAATGAARDRLYLQQQAGAHRDALALHKGYAEGGDNAALRAVAAKVVPIVEHHIHKLGAIKAE